MAALVVVVALLGGTDSLEQGADARVEMTLEPSAGLDVTRSELVSRAAGTWQATRVAESTEDGTATGEFSLPGASLDGFVGELREHPLADQVDVTLEVEPDQLAPDSLATPDGESPTAEPVRVEVTLQRSSAGGPWLTIGGAVIVAAMALVALVVVSRRFSGDDPYAEDADGSDASI